jgi:hypothetical protein
MRRIYKVYYEFADEWYVAGTVEAESKSEAITKVKNASVTDICLKHVISPEYIQKKMNFDVEETE